LKKIIKSYGLLALVAGLIILVDQVTKAFVRANLPFGGSWSPFTGFAAFIRIVNWENTGAAFGMFQGGGLIFGVLAAVVAVVIIAYFPRIPQEYYVMRIAIAMQMGGAIGNLIDRVRFGPVTDFIAVGAFPVFNIADASITVGVGILLLSMWIMERREKVKAAEANQLGQDYPETTYDGQL